MSTDSEDSDLSALSPLASELANTIARVASDIALVIDKDGVISAVAEGQAVQAQGCGDWVGQRWIDTVTASTRGKIQSLLDEVTNDGVASRRLRYELTGEGRRLKTIVDVMGKFGERMARIKQQKKAA